MNSCIQVIVCKRNFLPTFNPTITKYILFTSILIYLIQCITPSKVLGFTLINFICVDVSMVGFGIFPSSCSKLYFFLMLLLLAPHFSHTYSEHNSASFRCSASLWHIFHSIHILGVDSLCALHSSKVVNGRAADRLNVFIIYSDTTWFLFNDGCFTLRYK